MKREITEQKNVSLEIPLSITHLTSEQNREVIRKALAPIEKNPSMKITPECAREILGRDLFFGTEEVRETFGISIDLYNTPEIPYSRKDLEQAKTRGEKLVLRQHLFEDGAPITLENLMKRFPDTVAGEITGDPEDDAWAKGSSLLNQETPQSEWVLVRNTVSAQGTEHLSMEAQGAFVSGDYQELEKAIERMQAFWNSKDMITNGPPRDLIDAARNKIPSLTKLKALRESLPKNIQLPRAIEVVYDFILTKKEPIAIDLEIATSSKVDAGYGEPIDRPVDVGFVDGKMKIHTRRNMQFGRLNALGDKKPGIAIGYIQY